MEVAPNSYVDFFLKYPDYFPALLFLTLARIVPILAMAPFLGAKLMPMPVRIGLALSFFAILFPYFVATIPTPLAWNTLLIGYVIKELAIGFFLGFLAAVPFWIVQMSGVVIDNQRGSASMLGQDATTGEQTSTIGILFNSLLIVIFFYLNGPFLFFDAVMKSYQVIGPAQFPSADLMMGGLNSPFWSAMTGLAGKMFALSTQIAAPPLLAILMTDAFFGIINRLAPQVQISFLGQGLKSYLGDFTMWLAWFFILEEIGKMSLKWVVYLTDFLSVIK